MTYPGVQADWAGLHESGHLPPWAAYPYYVIDLPFSGVIDTALLPYDLWREHHDTNYWQRATSQVMSNHVPLWPPTTQMQ